MGVNTIPQLFCEYDAELCHDIMTSVLSPSKLYGFVVAGSIPNPIILAGLVLMTNFGVV